MTRDESVLPPRFIIYCRRSEEQKRGYSLPTHLESCQRYAVSRKNLSRPGLNTAINAAAGLAA